MSYCRANGKDSDVYVIATRDVDTGQDGWECVGCIRAPVELETALGLNLTTRGSYFYTTPRRMIDHLVWHRFFKDKVPEHAISRLHEDINRLGQQDIENE